jgi:ribosomal protein S18 acetylase RimI-like enzyme
MHTVTRASEADLHEILTLQKRAFESEARLYNNWSIPPLVETIESMAKEFARGIFLKVSMADRIVGSVRGHLIGGRCEIGRLMVSPECRGQGIGSDLLRSIESSFPQAESFKLFTGSLSEGNIRLYIRHGYAVYRKKHLSPTVSLVYMKKTRHGNSGEPMSSNLPRGGISDE